MDVDVRAGLEEGKQAAKLQEQKGKKPSMFGKEYEYTVSRSGSEWYEGLALMRHSRLAKSKGWLPKGISSRRCCILPTRSGKR